MPSLKRTNASVVEQKTKRPRLRLNIKKECGINISLPSPEWFDKTYGPIEDDEDSSNNVTTAANTSRARVKVTAKTTARKKANGQKIKKKSSNAEEPEIIEISDDEVQFNEEPQISDGEELFVAFPQSTSSLNGSDGNSSTSSDAANLNIGISRCQQKADSSLNPTGEADDDDGDSDIMILFEKMAQRPEPEKPVIKKDEPSSSNQENRVVQPVVLVSTEQQPSTSQKSSPKHKSPKKVDWEQVFGVIPHPDRRCYELISKYRQKYTKEFRYLDKSIWRHMSDNIQNDHTYTWKMRVKNILQDMIRQMHPDQKCDLLPVGSTVNGCGAFNSDMDLCLCLPSIDDGFTAHRSVAAKLLKKIQKRLFKERAFIHRILHIPAKVPILRIRFCPPYEELEVDMNLNNLPGIYNSYLLHHYSRIDDRFPALCLLIKHWAKRRGIGDASAGFFNSYSLILMVLHFLQCGADPPILPNLQKLYPDHFVYCKPLSEMHLFQALPRPLPEVPENKQTVGELLIAFFVYFNKFDFNRNGISIHRGGVFDRDVLPRNCRRFKIFIEEPFDWQNTARCVTDDRNWEMILRAFQLASMHFTTSRGPPDLNNLIS